MVALEEQRPSLYKAKRFGSIETKTISFWPQVITWWRGLCSRVSRWLPSAPRFVNSFRNSIIFIHGLTGDRERTWRAKTATAPWPQSLLPSKIPNARILTFGYDAYVADWKGVVSNNRIGNHSMNLITSISTYRDNDETVGIEPVEKWEVRSETDIDRMIGLLFSFAIVWAVLCVRMQVDSLPKSMMLYKLTSTIGTGGVTAKNRKTSTKRFSHHLWHHISRYSAQWLWPCTMGKETSQVLRSSQANKP